LCSHIKSAKSENEAAATKKNLLNDEATSLAETPIWLTITTKRHIHGSNQLTPHRVSLPHSLNVDPEATICIISASPQRAYKNIVASAEFPEELRKRITRVIDVEHLKKKFAQYEAQRKLRSEHEIFLGDESEYILSLHLLDCMDVNFYKLGIINRLPQCLGKTFYKSTAKRPIPVVFALPRQKQDGKRIKRDKKSNDNEINAQSPACIAGEIERALGSALVSLSPAPSTSIKVGYADWPAANIAANVEAVTQTVVGKYVSKGWDNVRGIYIKGPQTMALPIWQTDSLPLAEGDVLAEGSEELKAIEQKREEKLRKRNGEQANVGKKRKSLEVAEEGKKERPLKKAKSLPESNDGKLDTQIAERKTKLGKHNRAAKKAIES